MKIPVAENSSGQLLFEVKNRARPTSIHRQNGRKRPKQSAQFVVNLLRLGHVPASTEFTKNLLPNTSRAKSDGAETSGPTESATQKAVLDSDRDGLLTKLTLETAAFGRLDKTSTQVVRDLSGSRGRLFEEQNHRQRSSDNEYSGEKHDVRRVRLLDFFNLHFLKLAWLPESDKRNADFKNILYLQRLTTFFSSYA